jgi:hypothetical protein
MGDESRMGFGVEWCREGGAFVLEAVCRNAWVDRMISVFVSRNYNVVLQLSSCNWPTREGRSHRTVGSYRMVKNA